MIRRHLTESDDHAGLLTVSSFSFGSWPHQRHHSWHLITLQKQITSWEELLITLKALSYDHHPYP